MLYSVVIAALLAILLILSLLLSFCLHSIRTMTHLHFRELVATRHQYIRIIDEQRLEIRGLTESLVRTEGKVYLGPSALPDVPDSQLSPSYSSFRMRPNPPQVRFVGNVSKEAK
jgi:hypothetical protein